jgi:stress response protein YsnF
VTRVSLRSRLGRQSEAGRARLKKYVVTEEVTQTVPVQREEVRLETEPITDAKRECGDLGSSHFRGGARDRIDRGGACGREAPVPRERVRMTKDRVTDEEQVSQEVRKEHIETGIRR